jgi:uncharacterized protein YjeT (DUF2065 family)
MDTNDFLTALALLFIFEGLMPFASPSKWKDVLRNIVELDSSKIRMFGFASMIGGLLILYTLN